MAEISPPPVADIHASIALDDVYQGGHADSHTRVGRSMKRIKMAESMNAAGRITDQELGQQQVFLQQQSTSALPPGAAIPDAPAWFGPAIAAALQPIHVTLNNMNERLDIMDERLDNIDERLDNFDGRLSNIQARQANATVMDPSDELDPIHNTAGQIAPNFPATLKDLHNLTNNRRFYQRPANPIATQDQRLKQILGIRPQECIFL